MHTESISTFSDWRTKARKFIMHAVPPDKIVWQAEQRNLLSGLDDGLVDVPDKKISIPREFLTLAQTVACHREAKKWDWLYQALWRITHNEKHLLQISSDPLIHHLFNLHKAVRRDAHKMKAFVRFRRINKEGEEFYLAWYRPDHNIVRLVAPFFMRRFSVMKWTIMTPDETVSWDGEELNFSPGIPVNTQNIEDNIEELWLTYYGAIFNPARIKIKAMKNEMPIRFWHGLPEAAIIPQILADAPRRVEKMMKEQEGLKTSAAEFLPAKKTLISLREAANVCKGCDLYKCAKQSVFGEGPESAKLIIVGEQPGLEEDTKGQPFVGPAGRLLREALEEAKIPEKKVYITNAVKHFKFQLVNGRKLHRTPSTHEVAACKPWINAEIEVIQPQLVLCLGLTAAKSLIRPGFTMKKDHGIWSPGVHVDNIAGTNAGNIAGIKAGNNASNSVGNSAYQIAATYHPSAILRSPTPEMREEMRDLFKKDLQKTAKLLNT